MAKTLNAEIKNELIDKGIIFPGPVVFIGQGEGHENYIAEDKDQKVVIRVKRSDTPRIAGFKNERTQLLFLETQNISFAPKSLYYNAANEVHVVTYFPGNDISFLDLSTRQSKTFIDQIITLESLSYDDYVRFCDTNNFAITVSNMNDQVRRNFDNRLKTININRHLLPPDIDYFLQWTNEKFSTFTAMADKLQPIIHYSHGDLHHNNGTSNLRVRPDGTLLIIDWEDAGFVNDIFLDLGNVIASAPDIKNHTILLGEFIEYYINATQINSDRQDIVNRLRASVWYETVCVPLWMIERYVLSVDSDKKRAEDYLEKVKIILDNSDLYFNYKY